MTLVGGAQMDSYRWSESISADQYEEFYKFYTQEWWTEGRSPDAVANMLKHSAITLFCRDEVGKIAGFARVLTDYTFKALIFDVIVAENYRGNGLGQAIIQRILNHQVLAGVKSFELYCPDRLVPFYEKLGFEKGTSSLLFNQSRTAAIAS